MLKIMLTGATGGIGSSILNRLLQEKIQIYAISRNIHQNRDNLYWLQQDLNKPNWQQLKNILQEVDIVIHNAAVIKNGLNFDEIKEILQVNISFTETLFNEACKNAKKVIFTSSIGIHRPLPPIIDETFVMSINPTLYHTSKFWGEEILQKLFTHSQISFYILRVSSPIAEQFEQQQNNVVKKWIVNAFNKLPIEVWEPERTQNFVHSTDIAEAIWQIIQKEPERGIYNIASSNSISMLALAQLISEKIPTNLIIKDNQNQQVDKWNISIKKAQNNFNYSPKYDSYSAVEKLIQVYISKFENQ
ncbi:MAG: NAD(P)-dependent oxidoreductase [Candidatus Calescibacterium sp.]|nr:NAD(P)-dependent oxidoreductase [Candidatus Calescibacterium sp.]